MQSIDTDPFDSRSMKKKSIVSIYFILIFLTYTKSYSISDDEFIKFYKDAGQEINLEKRLHKYEDVMEQGTERQRFLIQHRVAITALEINMVEKAEEYANEILIVKDKYKDESLYGSVVHHAYNILGRIYLHKNDLNKSKDYLILSAKIPGSPPLRSFGPNLKLANILLNKGEKETVLEYLTLCRKFWEFGANKIDKWIEQINKGCTPDFGKNLNY